MLIVSTGQSQVEVTRRNGVKQLYIWKSCNTCTLWAISSLQIKICRHFNSTSRQIQSGAERARQRHRVGCVRPAAAQGGLCAPGGGTGWAVCARRRHRVGCVRPAAAQGGLCAPGSGTGWAVCARRRHRVGCVRPAAAQGGLCAPGSGTGWAVCARQRHRVVCVRPEAAGAARLGSARLGSARRGSARLGAARLGSAVDRTGLERRRAATSSHRPQPRQPRS